ncbi:transglutaminase family protein [Marinobacterium stanieri]|uniref:Transglutaminase-like enzyme, putative cysteine protease n=1 Tax=Marinobacterium stanieri TaxID=49186 RepID=A0A1N6TFZ3_9GAMM|nr:transglutaminase family protein [Marinobacterium stanieri]SIQ52310.1 Transglutaminase-like enzyme, putative cysteine protease [Marinobacterium stanieri]
MIYRIRHITRYAYDNPVSQCYNKAHLLPRNTPSQRCLDSRISIAPQANWLQEHTDYFGNRYCYFMLNEPHRSLEIDITSRIEVTPMQPENALDLGCSVEDARERLALAADEATLDAHEFLLDSAMIRASAPLREYAEPSFAPQRSLLSATRDLTRRIFEDFTYDPEFSTIATPLKDVLKHKRGVCQDFAHLAIGCLRSLGFPARYVSGYLETLPPPGQEKLVGADASHAWFAVYSPGDGWFEFDPTNDNMPAGQHIVTAWGRDYADVTPLQGVIFDGGGEQTLEVSVDVARV